MAESTPFTPDQRQVMLGSSIRATQCGLIGRYATIQHRFAQLQRSGTVGSFAEAHPLSAAAYERQADNMDEAAGAETVLVFLGIEAGQVFAQRINLQTGVPMRDSLVAVGYAPSDMPTRRTDNGFEAEDLNFALDTLREQAEAGLTFRIAKSTWMDT